MSKREKYSHSHSDKRKHHNRDKSPKHDPDPTGSSDEKDAKRQKLSGTEDVAVPREDRAGGEAGFYHLKALEPIDPPEGQPNTVKEIHALLFNEQLPEEFEARCRLTKCELCCVELASANAAKMHYYGKPHQRNVCKFLPSIGYVPPTKRHEQVPETVLFKPEENMKFCHVCGIELRNEVAATSHYGGKNHAKRMKQFEALKVNQGVGLGISHSAMAKVADDSPGTSVADTSESAENGSKGGWKGRRSTAFCLPCQADFNTDEEYTAHITSDAHKALCRNYGASTSSELTESEYKYGKAEPISDISEMLNKLRNDPLAAFECTMCGVKATCEENYRVHLEGKKHKKLVEKLEKTNGEYVKPPPKMTPFRCEYCQINCTDHTTMSMHLTGRKHLKKMADMGMLQVAPAPQQYHQYQQYQQYNQQYAQYYAGYGGYGQYGYGQYPEEEGGEHVEGEQGQAAEEGGERGEDEEQLPPGEEPPSNAASEVPSFADDI